MDDDDASDLVTATATMKTKVIAGNSFDYPAIQKSHSESRIFFVL